MTQVKMPEPVILRTVMPDDYRYGHVYGFTRRQMEAYAAAKVREALEDAAKIPRAYAENLDRQGWGNRFPDELTAIFNASNNMADRIRALIPPGTEEKE